VTDRKLQVSNYAYDGLNRLTSASFGIVNGVAQSSFSVTYDAGNRPHQVIDSLTGTIALGFDPLDRLTSEANPEGSIGYTFDNANRRQTSQVAGQPLVQYNWDADNRLMGISQGTTAVGFTYDADYRRQTMTLPNGILASYIKLSAIVTVEPVHRTVDLNHRNRLRRVQ
jgi:YD repeat-containing protein